MKPSQNYQLLMEQDGFVVDTAQQRSIALLDDEVIDGELLESAIPHDILQNVCSGQKNKKGIVS